MPNLQIHQLRVASVGKLICDNLNIKIDTENIVDALLLHDMGNIIKFRLELFPQFLEPEGLDYWSKVQEEYKEKYGLDEHHATQEIATELGVSERVFELISNIGFSNSKNNSETTDLAKKICAYSDMRVTPNGITSLNHRLEEGNKRYADTKHTLADKEKFEINSNYLREIEKQVFANCKIKPEEINDQVVENIIKSFT